MNRRFEAPTTRVYRWLSPLVARLFAAPSTFDNISEVRVKELEISEMLILEVTQDSVFVLVDVETTFSADVTYDDLETAAYDSEDKVLIPLRAIDKIVDRDVKYVAALRILHDVKHSEYFIVNRVELQSDQASGFDSYVDFAIHIDNEWPYK